MAKSEPHLQRAPRPTTSPTALPPHPLPRCPQLSPPLPSPLPLPLCLCSTFRTFVDLGSRYKRTDNPLLIPEANYCDRPEVAANAFYAFGKLDAIGFAPFSIESIDQKQPNPLAAPRTT